MASGRYWTIVFEDKCIIKNHAEGANEGIGYRISDDDFWGLAKWSNIWAIQYGTGNPNDSVEYRDDTPHSTYDADVLGDFRTTFINRFDAQHLADLQSAWDNNNDLDVADESAEGGFRQETEAEKITRLGARPTSYTSA